MSSHSSSLNIKELLFITEVIVLAYNFHASQVFKQVTKLSYLIAVHSLFILCLIAEVSFLFFLLNSVSLYRLHTYTVAAI